MPKSKDNDSLNFEMCNCLKYLCLQEKSLEAKKKKILGEHIPLVSQLRRREPPRFQGVGAAMMKKKGSRALEGKKKPSESQTSPGHGSQRLQCFIILTGAGQLVGSPEVTHGPDILR